MYFYHLKSYCVFLIGFGIGFLLALLLFIIKNTPYCSTAYSTSTSNFYMESNNVFEWLMLESQASEQIILQTWNRSKNSSNVTYSKWLADQELKLKNIDIDVYLYGPKNKENTEANWLKSKVHITCVVFVKKIKLAKAIRDTWGKRCNKLYFFGREKNIELPIINFEVKLMSSWQLLCEAFNYIWKQNTTLEWLIFVKDDTLVIPENLRYMLSPLDHTEDYYLGHAVLMWRQSYNTADAGYVISVSILRKLITMFDNSQKCLQGGKYWKQEDYYLAKHLASMGIYPSDTRDQYLKGTFHSYALQSLLWGIVKTSIYWTRAVYPVKKHCCSLMSVTFNAGEADKMYTWDYILYYLHVLNSTADFGSRTPVTSVPDKDVWRIALQEEFNITSLNDVSSDAYYEIWHKKYSEPGQLIAKDYKTNELN